MAVARAAAATGAGRSFGIWFMGLPFFGRIPDWRVLLPSVQFPEIKSKMSEMGLVRGRVLNDAGQIGIRLNFK
jgi:hypothetical protein